ncbi:hypothetical protein BGZ76_010042 [Entomortierella beljakovae]|nr:hypothetical protein BGZ76_010042 [Entomortierella beljakovae]
MSSNLTATNSWDAPVGIPNKPMDFTAAPSLNQNGLNEMTRRMETTTIANEESYSYNAPTVTLEEVWPKFREADLTRDLDDVKPALATLCEAFRGKSWSDLERKLREEGCNTYLVATDDPVSFGYTLVNLRGESNQRFRVIPTFIKPGSVKRGRMAIGMPSSIEENISRLDHAGVVRPSGVQRCHNCKQEGHVANSCPEGKREPEKSAYFGKCYNCGSEDHRTRTCTVPKRMLTCRNCKGDGHMAKDCPEPTICSNCNEEGHISRECDKEQYGHMSRECPEPRTDMLCNRCQEPGHISRDCLRHPDDIVCTACNQTGHIARECGQSRYSSSMTCYKCNEVGHRAFECPNNQGDTYGERRPPRTNRIGFNQGF